MDPECPAERVEFMVADSGAAVVLGPDVPEVGCDAGRGAGGGCRSGVGWRM